MLLEHVLSAFEPGVRYPEREVNERLVRFNADIARLRRSLVEHGLMAREGAAGRTGGWREGLQTKDLERLKSSKPAQAGSR